jgi:hypothetical protein
MPIDLRQHAGALKPVLVQEYLRSRGWLLTEDDTDRSGIVVYRRNGQEIEVPQRPDFIDYAKRVQETVEAIAASEGQTVVSVFDELTQPPGDTLAVGLRSERTLLDTVPLVDSLKIREATKNMLLSAAHSALAPQAHFPRMSRAEAVALLASVREAQSQRGSFVSRFVVPIDPAVGEQATLSEPFPRRVVRLLMEALDAVRRVRAVGAYDELLSMENRGVSGNLLAALASLEPVAMGGSLDVSVSWSRNRAEPSGIVSRVRFVDDALRGLDAVADAMRDRTQTKGFEVVGYVARLDRDPPQQDTPGDVVIVPTIDIQECPRVHVRLEAHAYNDAITAHETGREVRVIGTLERRGRRWVLSQPTGFELLPVSGDDEPGPSAG